MDGSLTLESTIGIGALGLPFGTSVGPAVASGFDLVQDGKEDFLINGTNNMCNPGAVYSVFLDGSSVQISQVIGLGQGGFDGLVETGDFLGSAQTGLGAFDGNGAEDFLEGAQGDDDGGSQWGAAWIVYLQNDGTVLTSRKLSALEDGFGGMLSLALAFGTSAALLGGLGSNGTLEVVIGAAEDTSSGVGSVWAVPLDCVIPAAAEARSAAPKPDRLVAESASGSAPEIPVDGL